MKGTIYLIEAYNEFELLYKIGYTKKQSVEKRLKQLKTGNPNKLNIISSFQTDHGQKLETTLHRIFSHCRLEGEWFKLDEKEMLDFEKLCKKLEESFNLLKEKTSEIS